MRRLIPSRSELLTVAFSFVLTALLLFVTARVAYAQEAGAPAAAAGVAGAGMLAWCSVAGLFVHFVMSLLAPGTPTPWNFSTAERFYVGAGLSAVSGFLSLLQGGSTPATAAMTAIGTLMAALVAHAPQMGAKLPAKAAAAILLLVGLPSSTTGCGTFWQTHPAVAPDLQKTEVCVEGELVKDEAAGDTAVTIGIDLGVTCGPDAIQVVEVALAKVTPVASAKSKAAVLLAARHP